jgi:hypothetical protein
MTLELGILCAEAAFLPRALDLLRGVAEAELFLMDDAVRASGDPGLRAAIADGLEAVLCSSDAAARGVTAAVDGPRFGSQWDHARMVAAAARVVALTGGRIDDWRVAPRAEGNEPRRRVALRLTRAAEHPKTAQALRSAVGYAAGDLAVTVVIEPAARALLAHEDHPPELLRAIATLRALGHRFVEVARASHPIACDLEVSW